MKLFTWRPFLVFRKRRALLAAVTWSLKSEQQDWHIAMDGSLSHESGLRVYPTGIITCDQVTIRPYLFQKRKIKQLYRAEAYSRSLQWFLDQSSLGAKDANSKSSV